MSLTRIVSLCVEQPHSSLSFFFFFNDTATTEIYTLSLHDALPIFGNAGHRDSRCVPWCVPRALSLRRGGGNPGRLKRPLEPAAQRALAEEPRRGHRLDHLRLDDRLDQLPKTAGRVPPFPPLEGPGFRRGRRSGVNGP